MGVWKLLHREEVSSALLSVGEKAFNGMFWMELGFCLDEGRLRSVVGHYIIDQPGKLILAPSDREGGGDPGNNTGSIRVKIVKIESGD